MSELPPDIALGPSIAQAANLLAEVVDLVWMDNGLIFTHGLNFCRGRLCPIHNPSDHHMRFWPQHWHATRAITERICIHNVHHPDPDDFKIRNAVDPGVHLQCDGCCGAVIPRPLERQ